MRQSIYNTFVRAREQLLAARGTHGHWEGELSSSALSTATAVIALALVDRAQHTALIRRGLDWLRAHANPDGGWGDTVLSKSNISTTTLACAAFSLLGETAPAAESWLEKHHSGNLAQAILNRYGNDRTFSAPILAACALAGRCHWKDVPPLPFELAVLPPHLFKWLRLPVVSYALPALIAIGQVRHHHLPRHSWLRDHARQASLRVLEKIQPASGGFLEAIPLTSFVAMALAAMGLAHHPVAERCVKFLANAARPDGSWPIDVNLATWVTTLAVNALGDSLPVSERAPIRDWLIAQQHSQSHPYTNAPPGGWAWTDLPGGVPDADDTAGALLALKLLGTPNDSAGIVAGIRWLCNLQNRDGGIPTFCKGWGRLPFDRSSPDLTAHMLRALAAWPLDRRAARARRRALAYLARTQRPDGAWSPLWFGNEHCRDEENLTYGTATVLRGLPPGRTRNRATHWLLAAQNDDGSWGGGTRTRPSIEETALAICALAGTEAAQKGAAWLVRATDEGRRFPPAPIGLYFAKLWYYEKLYPLIFTVAALKQVLQHSPQP
ncbi:MAG: squalene--hopene cyclase [Verrucomicrobiae bacterium]|nr:squalene--hopene cyclase [Verrucomicrobiae bacterium]